MEPERPDEYRQLDENMEPTGSTAAWERFAPARDDLGPEVEPDWRDQLERGRDWFDDGPDPLREQDLFRGGSDPHVLAPDPHEYRRNWLGVRRRRPDRVAYLAAAILYGLLSISGWVTIADVVRTRSQGASGTFELEACRYQRTKTRQGAHHCVASFTDDDGDVQSPVKVVVEESPERSGTTRTGWLLGEKGWGDDVGLRSRILFQLFGLVLMFAMVVMAVRVDRKRRRPPPDDPFAWD